MKREKLRSIDTLMEDCILPDAGFSDVVEMSRRDKAIIEVLQTIPEDVYQKLSDMIDDFIWFIPHTYGEVHLFPTTIPKRTLKTGHSINSASKVLFLSPMLEKDDIEWSVVVAVVVHELAHIALDHEIFITNPKEVTTNEDEVYKKICEWGFEEEAIKHQEHHKQLE